MNEQLPKEESDTPNTDMHVTTRVDAMGESHHVVDAEFAREQERRIDQLENICQQIAELISGHEGHVFDDITNALISKW